ncbi:hypothetical protein Tco_0969177 [Tanacetum coccineum]
MSYIKKMKISPKKSLFAADQGLSVFYGNDVLFENNASSSLVLHQMTSDINRSELGITRPQQEQSMFKSGYGIFKDVLFKQTDSYISTGVGVSNDVLVRIEGVGRMKKKLYRIKGSKYPNGKLTHVGLEHVPMDPYLGTRGSNDLEEAREKESKELELTGKKISYSILVKTKLKLHQITRPRSRRNYINDVLHLRYVKTVNEEVHLQALVDGKKIIVTEASVRRDLQLNDKEGTDCLPNATIFEELTRMGTMASAIICLATNQKFNFSKYIFESMVKNLDNASKFLMYLRFVQVFLDKQLEGMQSHKRIYVTPSHTKKIFRNMRRVGKGFSGRDTPLFPTMMVQAQQEHGEGSEMPTDPHHTPTIIQPSTSQPQLKQRSRRPKRKDTEVPQPSGPTNNVADEAVNEEMDDSLERAATTATSLDAEQDRGNINKTQSKATLNEPSSLGTSSGSGPKRQETMGDTIAQTRFENVSKTSNDSLLAGVNTPRSDEDRLKLNELMEFCIKLQQRVLDLENTKTAQAQEITSLKLRVKKLEKKGGSRTHKLKRLYKVGRSVRVISSDEASLGDQEDASKQGRKINDIDKDVEFTLVDETQGRYGDENMFGVNDLEGDEVIIETEVASKDVNLSVDEVTLAQALAALKSAKPKADKVMLQEPEHGTITTTIAATTITAASIRPKAKGLVIHEQEQATTPKVSSQQPSQDKVQDKGKGIMVEEPVKMKKKDQISLDEELTFKLQAGEEEERLAREKDQQIEEANIVDEDKETSKLQRLIEVVPDKEEVAIDAIPLETKPLSIVDYKIHKEGKKTYYQIIRADGSSKMYLVFSHMLKSFDREDFETLWKLVKAKHGSTKPEEGYERVLCGDLKTMFDPHVEDQVWRNQQDYRVLDWKLYDSCGVHSLRKQNVYIHMLVEKRYPLTPATIIDMLNRKLQADHWNEMYYQLLKLITKQLKNQ